MRWRDPNRDNRSPILRDCVRGSGGYGSGWFTIGPSDTVAYDYTSDVWGTESGAEVVTETGSPIKLTPIP